MAIEQDMRNASASLGRRIFADHQRLPGRFPKSRLEAHGRELIGQPQRRRPAISIVSGVSADAREAQKREYARNDFRELLINFCQNGRAMLQDATICPKGLNRHQIVTATAPAARGGA